MRPNNVHRFAIPAEDISKFSFANAYRFLQHCFKDRLQIAGRATDNLQHLRCGGLLLQRFSKLTRAFLLRLKESCVLDGDHRLIGEGRGKFNLFVVKWPHGVAPQYDDADWLPLAQERDAEQSVESANPRRFAG